MSGILLQQTAKLARRLVQELGTFRKRSGFIRSFDIFYRFGYYEIIVFRFVSACYFVRVVYQLQQQESHCAFAYRVVVIMLV